MNGDLETIRAEIKTLRSELCQFRRSVESATAGKPAPGSLEPINEKIRELEHDLEATKKDLRSMIHAC